MPDTINNAPTPINPAPTKMLFNATIVTPLVSYICYPHVLILAYIYSGNNYCRSIVIDKLFGSGGFDMIFML